MLEKSHQEYLKTIGAFISVIIGFFYIFYDLGSPDARQSILIFGLVSIFLGIILVCLKSVSTFLKERTIRFTEIAGYSLLGIIQLFPIFLWFTFSGSPISDGTAPAGFTANWLFSIPHIAVLFISIIAVMSSIKDE